MSTNYFVLTLVNIIYLMSLRFFSLIIAIIIILRICRALLAGRTLARVFSCAFNIFDENSKAVTFVGIPEGTSKCLVRHASPDFITRVSDL